MFVDHVCFVRSRRIAEIQLVYVASSCRYGGLLSLPGRLAPFSPSKGCRYYVVISELSHARREPTIDEGAWFLSGARFSNDRLVTQEPLPRAGKAKAHHKQKQLCPVTTTTTAAAAAAAGTYFVDMWTIAHVYVLFLSFPCSFHCG